MPLRVHMGPHWAHIAPMRDRELDMSRVCNFALDRQVRTGRKFGGSVTNRRGDWSGLGPGPGWGPKKNREIAWKNQNLDRSVSFLRQETHEHVKTIKKRCLEAKNHIFRKRTFKKHVFLGCFPSGEAATHRRVFCLDFLGMFRLFWERLDLFLVRPFFIV